MSKDWKRKNFGDRHYILMRLIVWWATRYPPHPADIDEIFAREKKVELGGRARDNVAATRWRDCYWRHIFRWLKKFRDQ